MGPFVSSPRQGTVAIGTYLTPASGAWVGAVPALGRWRDAQKRAIVAVGKPHRACCQDHPSPPGHCYFPYPPICPGINTEEALGAPDPYSPLIGGEVEWDHSWHRDRRADRIGGRVNALEHHGISIPRDQ